ncbi:diacylglycerol/lipid kinase family protein [Flavobacterium sp.]|uniref:diacylglycerol/lipid kinase family protein n=1 Tax=Flavobacterium sp. TaxID=239 RepID=UPI0039E42CFA
MIRIHFIVNPISGNGKHNLTASMIRDFFPRSEFDIAIDYTKHKGHAIELAQMAKTQKPDYIIACGGDGTINEVASSLVNSNIKLGIVPVGSGNGLASNLAIPRDMEKAFGIIKKGNVNFIDVGTVNDRYFFSNMGIGIDATIIKHYEHNGKRTLTAYIKAALASSLQYQPRRTMHTYGNQVSSSEPFLLFVSNSNEMGYNMSLTPKASLQDGWLNLFLVPKIPLIQKLVLGYYVLRNQVEKFKYGKHFLIQDLYLEQPDTIFMDVQIDGEFHNFKTNTLKVSIARKGLKVLVP